jgi:hypothetical protein
MTAPATARPAATDYATYYAKYVELVPDGDVLDTLQAQIQETIALLGGMDAAADYAYAPGKWTVKEVVGHMADTERIFVYRALRFARGDATPLPGFDENEFVRAANFGARTLADLGAELAAVRAATVHFFRRLDEAAWARRGTANGVEFAVGAFPWIVAGHELHHAAILRERYLSATA